MYIIVVLIFTRATLPRYYVYIFVILVVYVLRTYIKTDDDYLLFINKAISSIYIGSESQRGVEIQINI